MTQVARPNYGEVSVAVSTTVCEAVSMGSNPIRHPKFYAPMAEWFNATDCKSVKS